MADAGFLKPFVIEPAADHELTVILLHGRGSSPHEFSTCFGESSSWRGPSVEQLQLPTVKWIFPSAKYSYSSVFKCEIREWFDIWSLTNVDAKFEIQLKGLGESVRHVREIIKQERELFEKDGKDSKGRVVLGGISMGCAASIHVMLSLLAEGKGSELGGCFGWCGWMPLRGMVQKAGLEGLEFMYSDLGLVERKENDEEDQDGKVGERINTVPVLLSHCTDDTVVDVRHGKEMRNALTGLGMNVKWTEYYSDDHWIKEPEAVDELFEFLKRLLSNEKGSEEPPAPQ